MISIIALTATLALGIAVIAAARPAFARAASNGSFAANLEGIRPLAARASQRTAMIRACNQAAVSLVDYTWGHTQSDRYRACMAEHGQIE